MARVNRPDAGRSVEVPCSDDGLESQSRQDQMEDPSRIKYIHTLEIFGESPSRNPGTIASGPVSGNSTCKELAVQDPHVLSTQDPMKLI